MPGSRALFYRPPFVSWVGHLSFVLRSLPLRSLRSLRETNGGYEWRTEDGTKTRQRRYEVKGTWGDDTRWTESVTPGPWSSGVVSSPHTVPFRFTVVSVPFAHSLRSSHSLHLTPSEATGTEWEGAEWGGPVPPAGTAKGRDGTEEWRPVPSLLSLRPPPGAGEWTEWAVPTEEARRATGPRFTRGTRKRAGPCPCRPEACTEGPKHSEGSEVRRPVPSLRPTSETVRRWREGCRGVGWGRERA